MYYLFSDVVIQHRFGLWFATYKLQLGHIVFLSDGINDL